MRWSVGGSTTNAANQYNEIQILTTAGVNLVTTSTVVTALSAAECCESGYPLSNVKDGSTSTYMELLSNKSTAAVQVDLGSVATNVRSIKFWNYWQDARTFYNVQIMISVDGVHWVKVYGPVDTLQTSTGTEVLLTAISTDLASYVLPYSYSYDIQPSIGYTDSGNQKLVDGIIAGHYYNVADNPLYWSQWVGWSSLSPVITFNFDKVVTISKVSIYFQGDHSGGIYLPVSVTITGSIWKTFTVGDLGINGWQDFTGLWSGQTITVKLASSSGYIFISEVMFTELKTSNACPRNLTSLVIPKTITTIGSIIIIITIIFITI